MSVYPTTAGHVWRDESRASEVLPSKSSGNHETLRGRDRHLQSTADEEADDIFESEFMMLKNIWTFDSSPYPVSKQVVIHFV